MAEQLEQAEAATTTRFFEREVSWLAFNTRVLELARDPAVPLLERLKFLAIFSTNLDEFFQIRYAGLRDRARSGPTAKWGGAPAMPTLLKVVGRVRELLDEVSSLYRELRRQLREAGIEIVDICDVTPDERAILAERFDREIFPILTPLAVDAAHPFPHISSLALNLAVQVRAAADTTVRMARVKIPPSLPRFVALPDGCRFVLVEELVAAHLDSLFIGMEVEAWAAFRVTRDADLDIVDDEAEDLLEIVEGELRHRRFGGAVRLETSTGMTPGLLAVLMEELELLPEDVYELDIPLDLGSLWQLWALDRADLKDEPWPSVTPPALLEVTGEGRIFAPLRLSDVFVHHPYESFSRSVGAFVEQAADDPHVAAIKLALYRTSKDSPIVAALLRAADSGKQVVVLVELKARFDEENNIGWARALEDAGAHVMYGMVGLKTHAKAALVVRAEPDGLHRYWHVGTGNYNPTTAAIYEDVGVLSSDPALGAELARLFNTLTGYSTPTTYQRIAVAPHGLRTRVIELIDGQRRLGEEGRIVMKMNSLSDDAVIEALYAASQAGCEIQLVVRGICRLRPGVPELSERITVRSIVGRYLEHSRIFRFGEPGDTSTTWLIGSADMMPRNLDRRVEVLAEVVNQDSRKRLDRILELNLS
ncbi:MAG: polyphosphate kinase, partial [Acidimicrobiia bacterium]|nr:polyphosphate kinase [Acidimicrobiia bacterium]